jgi:hypothetical protein
MLLAMSIYGFLKGLDPHPYYIRQNNLTKDIFMEYDEITHLITLGETQVDAWQLDLIGKCE